jgi:hypothetical protein
MQAPWVPVQADSGVREAYSLLRFLAWARLLAYVSGGTVVVPVGNIVMTVGTWGFGEPVGRMVTTAEEDGIRTLDDGFIELPTGREDGMARNPVDVDSEAPAREVEIDIGARVDEVGSRVYADERVGMTESKVDVSPAGSEPSD